MWWRLWLANAFPQPLGAPNEFLATTGLGNLHSRSFFLARGQGLPAIARSTHLVTREQVAERPDQPKKLRATSSRIGGRPARELAGDQPKNWRATSPRTGGRPARELAGDQPKNWRAAGPRPGGRPTREFAGDQRENLLATNNWRAAWLRPGGRPAQELSGDQPKNWRANPKALRKRSAIGEP